MQPMDDLSPRIRRWLGWSAVTLFVVTVAGIFLISAGITDPKPTGKLTFQKPLLSQPVAAGSESLTWLEDTEILSTATIRLTATYANGEKDSAYGLVIGEKSDYLVVALSPLGYVTIWQGHTNFQDATGCNCQQVISHEMLPWQPWPHAKTSRASNEIWLDLKSGRISTVRINREVLWNKPIELKSRNVGLWAKSYGTWTSIAFEQIAVYQ